MGGRLLGLATVWVWGLLLLQSPKARAAPVERGERPGPAEKTVGLLAAPLARAAVPPALLPWVPWVLRDQEQKLCPLLGETDEAVCAWSGALRLVLDRQGGKLTQEWQVLARSFIPLPGGERRWPFDVKADGKPAALLLRDGEAVVELPPGRHTVTGSFAWKALPDTLKVPAETGLVTLNVNGRAVPFPSRSESGELFLRAPEGDAEAPASPHEADSLQVSVHRKVTDDVPLLLTTRISLEVAGKTREVVLGKSLPTGFLAHALEADLPTKLEPDGRLRVQVRPGRWTVTLTARHDGPVNAITRPTPDGPWKEGEEVWVFEAQPRLRVATVSGVPAVDPQQTTLPSEWRALPAYILAPGATLTLVEERRGDAVPAPDQLTLERRLWLDFDGRGFTAQDKITGRFRRSERLSMGPGETLGRVSIDGADQFITRLPGGGDGVELRQGRAAITAESRIVRDQRHVRAAGWEHDFQAMGATLALPPGWRLLHASGADSVSDTWFRRWTLLQLFLVLVTAVAAGRLFGRVGGALALATLGLTVTEPEAPAWIWLAVLLGEALVRALGDGKAGRWLRAYRLGAFVALLLLAVPFATRTLRAGLFPAQERPAGEGFFADDVATRFEALAEPGAEPSVTLAPAAPALVAEEKAVGGLTVGSGASRMKQAPRPRRAADKNDDPLDELRLADRAMNGAASGGKPTPRKPSASTPPPQNSRSYDPSMMIQTGPGVPHWSWTSVRLGWNGPVERGQTLSLWLLPPAVNGFLAAARVALLAMLALRLLGGPGGWRRRLSLGGAAAPVAAACLALLVGRPARAAEFPPRELLDELRTRLLEKPSCGNACATAGRLQLEANPKQLRLRLEVSAAAPTAIPLPGGEWALTEVALDGKPGPFLNRDDDGTLWMAIPAGGHQILLAGLLPARDVVQLRLGLPPHAVTSSLRGWSLGGIDDEEVGGTLQLTRLHGGTDEAGSERAADDSSGLTANSLPPFVTVERTLKLGLKWQVETRVARATQSTAAALLEVPLLPGEAPVTEGLHITAGKVQVTLAPGADELVWSSTLEVRPQVALVAPKTTAFTEIWRLELGPLWHAERTGIPPVHQDEEAVHVPEWRPWPGEAVTLTLVKPTGAAGRSLTIDEAALALAPGLRSTAGTLTVKLRTSRGDQHAIALPPGATLEQLRLNGSDLPLRQEGTRVVVPLSPGAQTIALTYRVPSGLGLLFRAPVPDLGAPATNVTVELRLPADRWLLLVGGPRLGPSVLFWSTLVVLLLVAAGLGRSPVTPLRTRHWVLLGLGLSQVPIAAAALVAGYLLALGWRHERPALERAWLFNLRQLSLVFWTAVALGILFFAVQTGLLSTPDMEVSGNGSNRMLLRWFADRTPGPLPAPWALSTPLLVYRLVMLAWALWLALAVIRWARWAWSGFAAGGLWRQVRKRKAPEAEGGPAA